MLNGDSGDLGVGKSLGDEHDANGDAANDVLNKPLVVVIW